GHSKQLCDPDRQTPIATSADSFAGVNRPPDIDYLQIRNTRDHYRREQQRPGSMPRHTQFFKK
ncbi:hypothetical protein, partial [Marinobacter sp.]|uniref:hypothetical protein n=1 Tax=Marinobacter sp. TaxID=50741 RepID=UPI003A946499